MENYYTVQIALMRYTIVAPSEYIAAEQAALKFVTDVNHDLSKVTTIVNGKKIDVHVEKTFKVSASVV